MREILFDYANLPFFCSDCGESDSTVLCDCCLTHLRRRWQILQMRPTPKDRLIETVSRSCSDTVAHILSVCVRAVVVRVLRGCRCARTSLLALELAPFPHEGGVS